MRSSHVPGFLILLAGGLAANASAAPQYPNAYGDPYARQGQAVRCDSNGSRTIRCPIDTRGGVTLVRKLSDASCVQGRSWGYDSAGVWVSHGCRAEFRSNTGGYRQRRGYASGAPVLRCESDGGSYRQCPADTRGGVRLTRQLSSQACVEGRTWGAGRDGVCVNNGCRAEFQVGIDGNNGWGRGRDNPEDGGYYNGDNSTGYAGDSGASSVRCESNDGRTQRCSVAARDVRLQRQLSSAPCQEGQTWGWDPGGIWVSGGCRADFAIW